jgi:hypothetical protein
VEGSCEYGIECLGPYNFGNHLSSCTTVGFSKRAQVHGVSLVKITLRFPLRGLLNAAHKMVIRPKHVAATK